MSKRSDSIPVIGITTYGRTKNGNFYLPAEYIDAVRQAGGLPVLLTPGETHFGQVTEFVDGLIFAGGGDIDPQTYGGQPHASVSDVDSERDDFELKLAQHALQATRPVLGICRGCQLLNVATDGDLVAHLPEQYGLQIAHRTEEGEETRHSVQIEKDTRLADILEEPDVTVISKHHQALRTISSEWRIVAHAADGVVEAIEHKKHPWMIAVLWHPELAYSNPAQMKLLRAFINAAAPN